MNPDAMPPGLPEKPHRKYLGLEDVPPVPKRRCAACGCFLRSGNTGQYCAICSEKTVRGINLEARKKREQEKAAEKPFSDLDAAIRRSKNRDEEDGP